MLQVGFLDCLIYLTVICYRTQEKKPGSLESSELNSDPNILQVLASPDCILQMISLDLYHDIILSHGLRNYNSRELWRRLEAQLQALGSVWSQTPTPAVTLCSLRNQVSPKPCDTCMDCIRKPLSFRNLYLQSDGIDQKVILRRQKHWERSGFKNLHIFFFMTNP